VDRIKWLRTYFYVCMGIMRGTGSSVSIATGYGLDDPGIESRWGLIFFVHHQASCTLGTGSFSGVKRPGRGADHPAPLSTEVENELSYNSTPHVGRWWPVIG
jgi:hypothetical protein